MDYIEWYMILFAWICIILIDLAVLYLIWDISESVRAIYYHQAIRQRWEREVYDLEKYK